MLACGIINGLDLFVSGTFFISHSNKEEPLDFPQNMEGKRTDWHGMQKNPMRPSNSPKAVSVDIVVYNHVQAGKFGYAVAHTYLRTRQGRVLPKDWAFALELAKKFRGTAKYWHRGTWWTIHE